VSKAVDSQALVGLNRILGLAGAGSSETFLEDGLLQQTYDVGDVVRRSRTEAGSAGWFYGVWQNAHSGSGGVQSSIDPYALSAAEALNSWPAPVEAGFDVWLMYASMWRSAGSGALNAGVIQLAPDANMQCMSAGAGLETPQIPVAFWDSIDGVSDYAWGLTEQGLMNIDINKRLRRGTNITFRTNAAAAATYQMTAVLGLFPAGMGQDIAG